MCQSISYTRSGLTFDSDASADCMEIISRLQHKSCPRCRAEVHIRKRTCDCGIGFSSRADNRHTGIFRWRCDNPQKTRRESGHAHSDRPIAEFGESELNPPDYRNSTHGWSKLVILGIAHPSLGIAHPSPLTPVQEESIPVARLFLTVSKPLQGIWLSIEAQDAIEAQDNRQAAPI
jgi:hypothetical protein